MRFEQERNNKLKSDLTHGLARQKPAQRQDVKHRHAEVWIPQWNNHLRLVSALFHTVTALMSIKTSSHVKPVGTNLSSMHSGILMPSRCQMLLLFWRVICLSVFTPKMFFLAWKQPNKHEKLHEHGSLDDPWWVNGHAGCHGNNVLLMTGCDFFFNAYGWSPCFMSCCWFYVF